MIFFFFSKNIYTELPSGFKIYIFPSCIYRITTLHHFVGCNETHLYKTKRCGGNWCKTQNMDQQITSMITVTGGYCAFFSGGTVQTWASDQMSVEGGIPSLSKCNAVFVPETRRLWIGRGEKKIHSPFRWYRNQTGNLRKNKEKRKKISSL